MAALLPGVWRVVDGGWSGARRARYAAATLIFVAFGGMLAWWEALQPWNP